MASMKRALSAPAAGAAVVPSVAPRARPVDPFQLLTVFRDGAAYVATKEDEPLDGGPAAAVAQAELDKKKKKKKKKPPQTAGVPGTLTEQLKIDEAGSGKTVEAQFNLPVPESQKTNTFDEIVDSKFRVKNAYIRHRVVNTGDHEIGEETEYELSHEDMEWLRNHPVYGSKGSSPMSEDTLEKVIDVLERKTARNIIVKVDEAIAACEKHLNMTSESDRQMVVDVHHYWSQKRQRARKPLLRRFWPITAPNDSSPNLTFRPREEIKYRLRKKRQNDFDSLDKMISLRNDFEMMQCLLELVKRREQLKSYQCDLLRDEFEESIHELIYGAGQGPKVDLLAPDDITIGPLPQHHVEATFEAAQRATLADDRSLSPTPSYFDRMSSDTNLYDGLYVSDDRRERKRKRKTPGGPGGESGIVNNNKKKKKSAFQEYDALEGLDPEDQFLRKNKKNKNRRRRPELVGLIDDTRAGIRAGSGGAVLPHKPRDMDPPAFLGNMDHVQTYTITDSELSFPSIPTWPPPNQGLIDFQLRNLQSKQTTPKLNPTLEDEEPRKSLALNLCPPTEGGLQLYRDRKRFRCRTRIGRGGRIVIDRIPLASNAPDLGHVARRSAGRGQYIGPSPLDLNFDFLDPSKTRSEQGIGQKKLEITPTRKRNLLSIYNQDDEEQEEFEILDFPFLAAPRQEPEEIARLESIPKKSTSFTVRETKFRFVL